MAAVVSHGEAHPGPFRIYEGKVSYLHGLAWPLRPNVDTITQPRKPGIRQGEGGSNKRQVFSKFDHKIGTRGDAQGGAGFVYESKLVPVADLIRDRPSAMFTGYMRRYVQELYARGVTHPFNYTFGETHGLYYKQDYANAENSKAWVIIVRRGDGIYAWELEEDVARFVRRRSAAIDPFTGDLISTISGSSGFSRKGAAIYFNKLFKPSLPPSYPSRFDSPAAIKKRYNNRMIRLANRGWDSSVRHIPLYLEAGWAFNDTTTAATTTTYGSALTSRLGNRGIRTKEGICYKLTFTYTTGVPSGASVSVVEQGLIDMATHSAAGGGLNSKWKLKVPNYQKKELVQIETSEVGRPTLNSEGELKGPVYSYYDLNELIVIRSENRTGQDVRTDNRGVPPDNAIPGTWGVAQERINEPCGFTSPCFKYVGGTRRNAFNNQWTVTKGESSHSLTKLARRAFDYLETFSLNGLWDVYAVLPHINYLQDFSQDEKNYAGGGVTDEALVIPFYDRTAVMHGRWITAASKASSDLKGTGTATIGTPENYYVGVQTNWNPSAFRNVPTGLAPPHAEGSYIGSIVGANSVWNINGKADDRGRVYTYNGEYRSAGRPGQYWRGPGDQTYGVINNIGSMSNQSFLLTTHGIGGTPVRIDTATGMANHLINNFIAAQPPEEGWEGDGYEISGSGRYDSETLTVYAKDKDGARRIVDTAPSGVQDYLEAPQDFTIPGPTGETTSETIPAHAECKIHISGGVRDMYAPETRDEFQQTWGRVLDGGFSTQVTYASSDGGFDRRYWHHGGPSILDIEHVRVTGSYEKPSSGPTSWVGYP